MQTRIADIQKIKPIGMLECSNRLYFVPAQILEPVIDTKRDTRLLLMP
jgi:hypothetical protein